MEWSLTGLLLPITLRPPSPLTDDELMAFSHQNRLYRIEKNAEEDLVIMTPVGGEGGHLEARIIRRLMHGQRNRAGVSIFFSGWLQPA